MRPCVRHNLQATLNNRGVSHENGAIECAHGSFKCRLDQALKRKGSSDFAAIKDYQVFLDTVTVRLNKYCQSRFKDEQLALQALPDERFMDYSELSLKVTRSSTLEVKRVLYTYPQGLLVKTFVFMYTMIACIFCWPNVNHYPLACLSSSRSRTRPIH
jgi:hypothetical protein